MTVVTALVAARVATQLVVELVGVPPPIEAIALVFLLVLLFLLVSFRRLIRLLLEREKTEPRGFEVIPRSPLPVKAIEPNDTNDHS